MRSAQAARRLTDSADVRDQALAALKASIKAVPKYQNAPNLKPETNRPKTNTDNGIASKLLFLGLYDEAAPEIEIAGKGVSGDAAYTLADLYRRGDRGDRAVAFAEPLWKKVPADYPIELIPRAQLELLYPAPYAGTIKRVAGERGIDARFVLAVMRQESRFQPDARSVAAASGLMQLIPETAQKMAGELGRNYLNGDDLYYPATSILFGTQYLADLFKRFPGRPEAVAASYNGGPDNIERWLARSKSGSADRYVAEIVYAQSKDYVYKVMANYRMYQYLYDEELRAR